MGRATPNPKRQPKSQLPRWNQNTPSQMPSGRPGKTFSWDSSRKLKADDTWSTLGRYRGRGNPKV